MAELRTNIDPWYVVRAETGREEVVSNHLVARDIECFMPHYSGVRLKRDHAPQSVRRALFPGYLFSRFRFEDRGSVLAVPGVIDILSVAKHPTPILDSEVDSVRRMVTSGLAEPGALLREGAHVTVQRGPFAGIRGILLRIKDKLKVVVSIEILQRSVSVELDRWMIRT
jgi:transcription antitermination factor NusG